MTDPKIAVVAAAAPAAMDGCCDKVFVSASATLAGPATFKPKLS